jgi:hypothetical protein
VLWLFGHVNQARRGWTLMPSFLVKADPDADWYCLWSTIVDAPTYWGTRAELAAEHPNPAAVAPERFERADKNGTSAMIPGVLDVEQWFGWNDRSFILMEAGPEYREGGCWLLPRANLRAFCEALDAEQDTTPLCVWESHEDETDSSNRPGQADPR